MSFTAHRIGASLMPHDNVDAIHGCATPIQNRNCFEFGRRHTLFAADKDRDLTSSVPEKQAPSPWGPSLSRPVCGRLRVVDQPEFPDTGIRPPTDFECHKLLRFFEF